MSDNKTQGDNPDANGTAANGPEAPAEAPSDAAGPETTAPAAAEPAAESPEAAADQTANGGAEAAPDTAAADPVARLQAEVSDLKDQLLRALAEVENVRRRSQREREDALRFATGPLVKDLLGVADNLGRALESLPAGDDAQTEQLKPLIDGLKLTEKELYAAFERHNITKIDPLGERMDPHVHEAMFEVEDPAQPAGTVVQVVQSGYLLHDRLLRPARVGVSKGGPPAGANDNATEDEPGSHVDTTA